MQQKMIISGSMIERIAFNPLRRTNHRKMSDEEKQKRKELKRRYNAGLEKPDQDKTASSVSRARTKLRRLIYANAFAWKDKNGYVIPPKFLTLTFKANITDLKSANRYLSTFMQKLNRQYRQYLADPIQYVCVAEFQDRGAIHYHLVLFNFPFIDRVFKRLRDTWGGDRIHLKTIPRGRDVRVIIGYVSKYITKQATDGRLWGQKRYFASHELHPPITLNDDIAIELTRQSVQRFKVFENVFEVPYVGEIQYWSYYLGDEKRIDSIWLDPYAKEQINLAKKS